MDAGSSSSGGGNPSARTPHSSSSTRRSSVTASASGRPGVTASTNGASSVRGARASAAAANAVAEPENEGKASPEDGHSAPSPNAFSNKANLLLAFSTPVIIPQIRAVIPQKPSKGMQVLTCGGERLPHRLVHVVVLVFAETSAHNEVRAFDRLCPV